MDQEPARLVQDWLKTTMQRWAAEAKQYLDEHPDEPGVLVVPVIYHGDETLELDPIPFIRKDVTS